MNTRTLLFLFFPALLIAVFGLYVQIIRYEPLYPKEAAAMEQTDIPIFDDDPILGNRAAGLTVIVFGDLGCDSCRDAFTMLQDLTLRYPKQAKVIWKNISITRFPVSSETAHAYAYCAEEQQKFTAFVTALFAEPDLFREGVLPAAAQRASVNEKKLASCLASGRPQAYQAKNETLARAIRIQEAPAIFLEGKQIPAPNSIDQWIAVLHLLPSTP